jgi:phosphoglycolate phosphatase-like HAD superfamily hydrolase
MIKAIIFDFDGVIVESVNIKTEAFADIYRTYDPKVVEKVVEHHLANGGMSRFEKFKLYHRELLGKKLSDDGLSKITHQFSRMVTQKVIEASYVKGAIEFIESNYTSFDLFISSATPENELREIIEQRKIVRYFKEIFGSPETKSNHIRKIIRRYSYKSSEVVFIGDATNDKESAELNGIRFIGKYDRKNPDVFTNCLSIDDIFELKSIIKRIENP